MVRAALLAVALLLALPTSTRAEILPHPAGCPRKAFCGCGASVHLFGRPIRELYLARNWLKFPRSEPAYNMVAARRGHVFVLKEHLKGDVWRVFDANSGGRQTRMHARSIRGFMIVNPMAGRSSYASAVRD